MGYTTAYFEANHKLTNGCSQLSPSDLRDFMAYLNVPDINKFNVEKISWLVVLVLLSDILFHILFSTYFANNAYFQL